MISSERFTITRYMGIESDNQNKQTVEQRQDLGGQVTKITTSIKTADQPLVSFTINNPFTKVLKWLDQIRKKQETVFSIQLKMPLIVILSMFVISVSMVTSSKFFYDWGKVVGLQAVLAQPTPAVIILPTATPAPVLVTKLGILKGTYQDASGNEVISEQTSVVNPVRFMLEQSDGNFIFVNPVASMNLTKYLNKRILVTGYYDISKNTISVQSSTNIEVIPN